MHTCTVTQFVVIVKKVTSMKNTVEQNEFASIRLIIILFVSGVFPSGSIYITCCLC